MHEVQRNVPLPKVVKTEGRRKYPFEDMAVGDMFFVPGKTKNTLTAITSTAGRKLKRKFTTRLCYMVETRDGWKQAAPTAKNAVLGVGVWRVK